MNRQLFSSFYLGEIMRSSAGWWAVASLVLVVTGLARAEVSRPPSLSSDPLVLLPQVHQEVSSRNLLSTTTADLLSADLSDLDPAVAAPPTPQPTIVYDERLSEVAQRAVAAEANLDQIMKNATWAQRNKESKLVQAKLLHETNVWRKLYIQFCDAFLKEEKQKTVEFEITPAATNGLKDKCEQRVPAEETKVKEFETKGPQLLVKPTVSTNNGTESGLANPKREQKLLALSTSGNGEFGCDCER